MATQMEIEEDQLQNLGFICPICLEIYSNPVILMCGNNHVYCGECVQPYQHMAQPECPQCRQTFEMNQICLANELAKRLTTYFSSCKWCRSKFSLQDLKAHLRTCPRKDTSIPQFQPLGHTAQQIPSDVPNRSTFDCPMCDQHNLTCQDLVKHCNQHHKKVKSSNVVCPVCKVMPWGDPNLHSSDFLQHLNMRHKFEYDTFVDYDQDDDEMLRKALEASLSQY